MAYEDRLLDIYNRLGEISDNIKKASEKSSGVFGLTASLYVIGSLLTAGFISKDLKGFWSTVLAGMMWPYILGVALRGLCDEILAN